MTRAAATRYVATISISTATMETTTKITTIAMFGGAAVKLPEFNRHHHSTTDAIDEKQQNYNNPNKNRLTPVVAGMVDKRKLCFCSYGPSICEFEAICIKHEQAACFYAVKQEFNEHLGALEIQHMYGCAPLERGSNGSHFTCNAWRSIHSAPRSIACCYEGNNCNKNLTIPQFPMLEKGGDRNFKPVQYHHPSGLEAVAFLSLGSLVGLLIVLLIGLPLFYLYRKGKTQTWIGCLHKENTDLVTTVESNDNNLECDALLNADDSGSGSGGITLNQRTIAQDLQMLEMFARGRYGELRKAVYRGSLVAVKIFYTTEEQSWRNEREIYLSQMLNHENILQYVAADIMSSVESLTQMMLITDYHPLGSLYDYLRADFPLSLQEALELALSISSGLEHLHNPVRGTGARRKPEIAHRDIKSKNVLIKRPGVCCLADFGLAVRMGDVTDGCYDQQQNKQQILPQPVNIQVGTKRYMAPELLTRTLNVENFDEFKCADIYSFSLVLWEIVNCIELITTVDGTMAVMMTPRGRTTTASTAQQQQRLMSHSNSSGIATGSDPVAAATKYGIVIGSGMGSLPLSPLMIITPSSQHGCANTMDKSAAIITRQEMMGNNDNQNSKNNCTIKASTSSSPSLPATRSGASSSFGTSSAKCSQSQWSSKFGPINDKINEPIERTVAQICQQQQHRSHTLPYQMIVETDPSFEQMREIVCNKKIRPPMESAWNDEAMNPILKIVCDLMAECWSERPRSRHTALKMKKELARLVMLLQQQQHNWSVFSLPYSNNANNLFGTQLENCSPQQQKQQGQQ